MDLQTHPAGREIRDVALLDLTGAQAETALEGVTRISHVATILVPQRLLGKLSSIPMDSVAATIPVPDDARVRVFTGQITLSGEALANDGGQPNDAMVIAGQLILTSPVKKVGYSDVIVIGQVYAPTGSESALALGLRRVTGQVMYYPYVAGASVRVLMGGTVSGEALANVSGDANDVLLSVGPLVVTSPIQRLGYRQLMALGPVVVSRDTPSELLGRIDALSGQLVTYTAPVRAFEGKDHFSAGFFELFEQPITLVLDGKFSIDDDVTPELLRQKIAGIVLDGKLTAPRRLVPMLQVLCIARDGKISSSDESD